MDSAKIKARPPLLERYAWALAVVWTVIVVASLAWNVAEMKGDVIEAARIQARVAFEKDVLYRRWNAGHGGVYAPVTEVTKPNPYLSDIPERDMTTPLGKPLTLINPAYMTRQVHELAEEEYGVRGHITSLNPIRPENAPDPWETGALQAFERGETETSSVKKMEGEKYMRLMRPLITEKGCLKCHAAQGYQEGDVRGGISVSIPMAPLKTVASQTMLTLGLGHVLLWLMGLVGIVLGTQRLKRTELDRRLALEALEQAKNELEIIVEERTSELRIANEQLKRDITERKQAEEERERLLYDMGERIKELNCMYGVANSIRKHRTLEEVFRDVVALIPPGWQYPEITRARLRYDEAEYVSEPFEETEWKQSSDIKVSGEPRGSVEAYYLESRPEADEGPFLKEERLLIDSIAQTLSEAIEHKRAEEKIRRAAEEWRTTFDSISDFVSLHGKDYKVVRVNRAFADALKMEPGELVGRHCYELIHGTKGPHPDCPFKQVQKTKKPSTVEYFEPSLGKYVQVSVSPIINEEGECTGAVHITKDITERKQAEEALRESQEFARNIIDSSLDMIVAVDNKRRITEFNHAAEDAFGYHREEVIGKNANLLYADPKEGLAVHKQTIVSGHHVREILNRHRNGKTFPGLLSSSVLRDSSGEIVGVMGVSRDITERKLAEIELQKAHDKLEQRVEERTADLAIANEQLKQAKEAAEVATKAKSDFLASMSHELRTPLNAIIGFSEVLSDQTFGELNEKQLKYTNHVLTSGHHLLALINDILDLSKVEAGKMELERSTVAIKSLLEDSLVMIKEKAFVHRISLDLRIPDELSDLKFQADERKLKQIVFNLLSNAVKFTPDGGTITVEGRQKKDDLVVAVSDTGIGIEHEDLERVFGEFEQVDSTYARQQEGTGLGLALTRKLVELHGGRIRAESEGEGKGSTFTFMIPIKTDEREKEKQS